MVKFLGNIGATVALLVFLILIGDDCLHWYALPLPSRLHRGLFAGMTVLSSLNCFLLSRNLLGIRGVYEKTILKLVAAPAEAENKLEKMVRYTLLSVASALCFYASAAVWGVIYFGNGPLIGTGYVALFVFGAYDIISVVAGVKVIRLKRSLMSCQREA